MFCAIKRISILSLLGATLMGASVTLVGCGKSNESGAPAAEGALEASGFLGDWGEVVVTSGGQLTEPPQDFYSNLNIAPNLEITSEYLETDGTVQTARHGRLRVVSSSEARVDRSMSAISTSLPTDAVFVLKNDGILQVSPSVSGNGRPRVFKKRAGGEAAAVKERARSFRREPVKSRSEFEEKTKNKSFELVQVTVIETLTDGSQVRYIMQGSALPDDFSYNKSGTQQKWINAKRLDFRDGGVAINSKDSRQFEFATKGDTGLLSMGADVQYAFGEVRWTHQGFDVLSRQSDGKLTRTWQSIFKQVL